MCCKTQKLKAQSLCRRRRRWNNDKQPKDKMQKEEKLEEFRNFRISKRRKQRKEQRSLEEDEVKNTELFFRSKTQMRNKATKFAIEAEKKNFDLSFEG